MKAEAGRSVLDYFAELPDPRVARSRRPSLLDSIAIAIANCGADSWVHGELFGESKRKWVETILELPNRYAFQRHFGSAFSRLDPGKDA